MRGTAGRPWRTCWTG